MTDQLSDHERDPLERAAMAYAMALYQRLEQKPEDFQKWLNAQLPRIRECIGYGIAAYLRGELTHARDAIPEPKASLARGDPELLTSNEAMKAISIFTDALAATASAFVPESPPNNGEPDEPGSPGVPDEPGSPGEPEEPGSPGEPPGPVPNNAVCYVTGTPSITVSSIAGLNSAIASADAGDEIAVSDGTYKGGTIRIKAQGSMSKPIIIRPQNDDNKGAVIFDGVTVDWASDSSRVVFAGFQHIGGRHNFRGNANRIDRCQFRKMTVAVAIEGAINSRISRLDFSGYNPPVSAAGVNDRHFIRTDPRSIVSGATKNVLIDYCYIHDINMPAGPEATHGREIFAGNDLIAQGSPGFNTAKGSIIIDHCLFKNISYGSDTELITMKFGGYILRFCTIENCNERVVFRRSNNCEVRSCWFEKVSTCIEAYGSNHLIIGNHFSGGTVRINRGQNVYPHVSPESVNPYMAFKDSQVIGNTDGKIQWGLQNQSNADTPVTDSNHFGNSPAVALIPGGHTGTTSKDPGIAYEPAVKLLPSHVGLNVPDAVCARMASS